MQHASLGALLLAIVFILAVLIAVLPISRAAAAALIPLAALGAALNYYFAFAPPAWLRRMWQSSELYGFLSDRALAGRSPSRDEVLNRLCTFAVPAVGATSGAAAVWDDSRQALIVAVSRWGYLEPGRPVPEGSLLDAWRSNRATLVKQHEWVLPGGAAGSVYVVPIPCEVGPRGLLFVILPKAALFVSDDLALAARVLQRNGRPARQRDDARAAAGAHRRARPEERATGRGEQGTGGVFVLGLARPSRPAPPHQRVYRSAQKSPGAEFDDNRRRYLRLISESAVKMGELIDSLLVFSRMGRAEMLHTRVDLNGIVRQAQRDVMQADPGRTVEWVIDPLPTVPGDPSMLQLVFTNLLSNAFKYSRTQETRDH